MNTNKTLFSFYSALLLFAATSAFAQPANDNFDNRTVLSGSQITFGGSLAGATLETGEIGPAFGASGSVWWTWTAPASTPVIISMAGAATSYNCVDIYIGTNLGSLTLQIGYGNFAKPAGRYYRFIATAGTSYQIQVAGSDLQPFSLQLTATNAPVFIFQPQNCTVSPYGSAFFSAMVSEPQNPGVFSSSTTYQWFFNGAPIPRQTSPSLLVHGVTTNQAGNYSVIASNVDGIAQSTVATLTVTDTNPVPRIAALRPGTPNLIPFTLTGEVGRWYKIESSQDLQNWTNPIFIQLTNASSVLSIPRAAPNHFIRASLDVPTDVCVAQLKQLRWATIVYAIEKEISEEDSYGLVNLEAYVPLNSQGYLFPCPEGGTYTSGGSITNSPACTLHARGHIIPDDP